MKITMSTLKLTPRPEADVRRGTSVLLLFLLFLTAITLLPKQLLADDTFDQVRQSVIDSRTRLYRIDRPNVKQCLTEYRGITFRPGQRLSIRAGGGVQTGGSGKTWKRYVDPSGPNSDRLYHGLLWIPGVTGGGLQRLAGLINGTFVVPDVPQNRLGDLYLRLGYEDDDYHNNSYDNHDDGTEQQCRGVGPAWVEITVQQPDVPPAPPPTSQPAPPPADRAAPFDLLWGAVDENLLPLNPVWAWQRDHPGAAPNPADFCDGHPFSAPYTGQAPSFDSPSEWALPHDTCFIAPGRILAGHANWMTATYTGIISWDAHSNPTFGDDDYNLHLSRPDQAGLTTLNQGSLQLEFNSEETIDQFRTPWWDRFHRAVDQSDDAARTMINGKPAIVTGLIGIDGVHGGSTESHPVFALAVNVSASPADETWAIFVRNWGDEGWCSRYQHYLDLLDGRYTFQLPWRPGATGVTVVSDTTAFNGSTNGCSGPFLAQTPGQGVLVTFTLPAPEQKPRINGELHLRWQFPGAADPERLRLNALRLNPLVAPVVLGGHFLVRPGVVRMAPEPEHEADEGYPMLAARMAAPDRDRFLTAIRCLRQKPATPAGSEISMALPQAGAFRSRVSPALRGLLLRTPLSSLGGVPHPRDRAVLDVGRWQRDWATRKGVEQAFGGALPSTGHQLAPLPASSSPP